MKSDHFEAAKVAAILAGFLMIASTFLMNTGVNNYLLIYKAIEVQGELSTNATEVSNLHGLVATTNTFLADIINDSFNFSKMIWVTAFIVMFVAVFFLALGYYTKK